MSLFERDLLAWAIDNMYIYIDDIEIIMSKNMKYIKDFVPLDK